MGLFARVWFSIHPLPLVRRTDCAVRRPVACKWQDAAVSRPARPGASTNCQLHPADDGRSGTRIRLIRGVGVGHPRHEWLYTSITNGIGAGESLERALSHDLLELLQRDGNAISHRALDLGGCIELDDVQDPATRELLRHHDAAGLEI